MLKQLEKVREIDGLPVYAFSDGIDRIVLLRGEEPEGVTFEEWGGKFKHVEYYEFVDPEGQASDALMPAD
jgi:hypothetical protein